MKIHQLFGFALVGFFCGLQPVCKCRHLIAAECRHQRGSRKPVQTDLFEASLSVMRVPPCAQAKPIASAYMGLNETHSPPSRSVYEWYTGR